MTERLGPSGRPPPRSLPEAVVRTLRHEVGDFLQKVYASVAILRDRIPASMELERGVLERLWSRSQTCKKVLDAAHDLICDVGLDYQPLDFSQAAEQAVAAARIRFPEREKILVETPGPLPLLADGRRLAQVAESLLTNACEAARARVLLRAVGSPDAGEVEWVITDDGPGIAPELAEKLFTPFFTTRAGHSGMGLALGRKLIQLHGGRLTAGNCPEGGFQVQLVLPVAPPPGA